MCRYFDVTEIVILHSEFGDQILESQPGLNEMVAEAQNEVALGKWCRGSLR
jgi:hypothetical protein